MSVMSGFCIFVVCLFWWIVTTFSGYAEWKRECEKEEREIERWRRTTPPPIPLDY